MAFARTGSTLQLPDYRDPFVRRLYATYLSYLDTDQFGYNLEQKTDNRGCLAEFLKSPSMRVNLHLAHETGDYPRQPLPPHEDREVSGGRRRRESSASAGSMVTKFSSIRCRGTEFRVVDIPPGYAHSIENIGATEMITLFWACEVFDPEHPETYFLPVLPEKKMLR